MSVAKVLSSLCVIGGRPGRALGQLDGGRASSKGHGHIRSNAPRAASYGGAHQPVAAARRSRTQRIALGRSSPRVPAHRFNGRFVNAAAAGVEPASGVPAEGESEGVQHVPEVPEDEVPFDLEEYGAVVKLLTTYLDQDWVNPWQTKTAQRSTGSGAVRAVQIDIGLTPRVE